MLELYDIRIELFMRYVNENGMIFYNSLLKFCDIGGKSNDSNVIINWFANQIGNNLFTFQNKVEKYKDIYPNAYELVLQRINNVEKRKNVYERKVELFVSSVISGNFYVNGDLKFCEICSDIRDNRSIKYWFLWQIFRNVDELRLFVSRYEVNYPGLIKTIDALIEDCTLSMGCEFLLEEEKVKLFMNYFNDNNISSFKYKLSFVDIGAKDNRSSIKKWFNIQLNYNFDWFVSEVSKYASI